MARRQRFTKVDPASVGLSFGYAAPPSDTHMEYQVLQETIEEEKQKMREMRNAAHHQQAIAECPRCRKLWQLSAGCPVYGRTKLKPDIECPNPECWRVHEENVQKKIAALEERLAGGPHEQTLRELSNIRRNMAHDRAIRDQCRITMTEK